MIIKAALNCSISVLSTVSTHSSPAWHLLPDVSIIGLKRRLVLDPYGHRTTCVSWPFQLLTINKTFILTMCDNKTCHKQELPFSTAVLQHCRCAGRLGCTYRRWAWGHTCTCSCHCPCPWCWSPLRWLLDCSVGPRSHCGSSGTAWNTSTGEQGVRTWKLIRGRRRGWGRPRWSEKQ